VNFFIAAGNARGKKEGREEETKGRTVDAVGVSSSLVLQYNGTRGFKGGGGGGRRKKKKEATTRTKVGYSPELTLSFLRCTNEKGEKRREGWPRCRRDKMIPFLVFRSQTYRLLNEQKGRKKKKRKRERVFPAQAKPPMREAPLEVLKFVSEEEERRRERAR